MKNIIEWLQSLYEKALEAQEVLSPVRFVLLALVAEVVALLFAGQGTDALVALGQEPTLVRRTLFTMAACFFALGVRAWSEIILSTLQAREARLPEVVLSPRQRALRSDLRTRLPHALSLMALIIAALSLLKAAWTSWETARLVETDPHERELLVATALRLVFMAAVLPALAWLFHKIAGVRRLDPVHQKEGANPNLSLSYLLSLGRERMVWLILGLTLLVTLAALFVPVGFGSATGTPTLFFLAITSWITVGTALLFVIRSYRLPLLSILLAMAVLFSTWMDNHHVRTTGDAVPTRPTVAEALEAWQERNPGRPLVLVATAGGGIRASYWTGTVLGALADQVPDFREQLFAMAGVSGGSVGATFFRAELAAPGACAAAKGYRKCILDALDDDFLSPTLASMFYPDLLQRFLPVAVFPDRQRALEHAFEGGWAAAHPNATRNLLAGGFHGLWQEQPPWPALLLDTTSVSSGEQVVVSNLRITPTEFPEARDFFDMMKGQQTPASTAAGNSARFPYVSPAGTIPGVDRIVDGGYYENFGADTLLSVLDVVLANLKADNPSRVLVIQISSDPNLQETENAGLAPGAKPVPMECTAQPGGGPPPMVLSEVLDPLSASLATRNARGLDEMNLLYRRVKDFGQPERVRYLHFRMFRTGSMSDAPLGWLLSQRAQSVIQLQLDVCQQDKMAAAVDFLKGGKSLPSAAETRP